MNIYGKLIFLCAATNAYVGCSAFTSSIRNSPLSRSTTFLNSESEGAPADVAAAAAEGVAIPTGDDAAKPAPVADSKTKALEDRLFALEQGNTPAAKAEQAKQFWDNCSPIKVQGSTLKTWNFASPFIERVQVVMSTEGRPLDADVELWQGPDNVPVKMKVYIEDGALRPFGCVVETPKADNTIAIRNIGAMEHPFYASVVADTPEGAPAGPHKVSGPEGFTCKPTLVQGEAIKTCAFDATVDAIQILINTDGRPLNSKIELLQGPSNQKQVVDVYTEDGLLRPFFIVVETPGAGNIVRIKNTYSMEYPITVWCDPYIINDDPVLSQPTIMGL